jgi:cytochrome c oxidase subunit 2
LIRLRVFVAIIFLAIPYTNLFADAVSEPSSIILCQSCHGYQFQGNKDLNAPAIAGLSQWYLYRQLLNYKNGIRGTNPEDILGQTMQLSILNISNAELNALAAYISKIASQKQEISIKGDVGTGKFVFEHCMSCHGEFGEGDKTIGAPRLTGQSDWYLYQQLINFQKGIRGQHPNDLYGRQMKDMANMFNDQMLKDVINYITATNLSVNDE